MIHVSLVPVDDYLERSCFVQLSQTLFPCYAVQDYALNPWMALPLLQLKSERKMGRTGIKLGHDSYKGRSMIGGSSEPALRISSEDDSSAFPLCQIQLHSSLCLCSISIPRFKCPQCHPADSSCCGSIIVSSVPITTKHLFSRVSEHWMRLRLKTTYEVIAYSFK